MMPFQDFAPAYPMGAYPQQQPVMQQPRPTWQGQPSQPVAVRPVAPPPRAPVIRAQSDDEPQRPIPVRETTPVRLELPSPEQLGLNAASGDEPDWATIHKRLEQLGAIGFHLDKLPTGKYRVNCLLPTGQLERTHCIEVEAGSKGEAVRLAVSQAEGWANRELRASKP